MSKTTLSKMTALILVILTIMTLGITIAAAHVHAHEDGILPCALGNCCSDPVIENYRLDHYFNGNKTSCFTEIRQYCWNCGATYDYVAQSDNGCTGWCVMTKWDQRTDPRK